MTENQNFPDSEEQPAPTGIVVGVDGSEHSECALTWAIAEAKASSATLNLVTAYSTPVFAASGLDGGFATVNDEEISRAARSVVAAAAKRVTAEGVECTSQVANGDATGVLLECSKTATMTVIGSRGRGGFLGRLLGSVASGLPAHAKSPTVVVPQVCAERVARQKEQEGADDIEPVVCVGVDGSDQARLATLVAAQYAKLHHFTLEVLCAIPSYTATLGWLPSPVDEDAVLGEIQEQLAAGEQWLKSHVPGVTVRNIAVEGNPIEQLIAATERCELVVAGSHGHGGFAGMLMGSTTDGLLHHAKGPTMVVVDREDTRLQDRDQFGPALRNV